MIIQGLYSEIKVFADIIDPLAVKQLQVLADQPFTEGAKIRIMADCHPGKGCVIGTTMTVKDRIVPNLVGVDIGCGMLAVSLGKIPVDLDAFDSAIYRIIPSGADIHKEKQTVETDLDQLRCLDSLKRPSVFYKSMGTLGGGNHFIEIDSDEEGNQYLIIHTGSRNLGKQVAESYQMKGIQSARDKIFNIDQHIKDTIVQYKADGREKEIQSRITELKKTQIDLPMPEDLCYVEGNDFDDYLHDIEIVQKYASKNRKTIASKLVSNLGRDLSDLDSFETIHNYISPEDRILRKGSIAAYSGSRLLIPINMRDGCLICTGRSNPDYNYSAPHGAGRLYSRADARKQITLQEYQDSMKGIYSTSVHAGTLDESCFAYKPIEDIVDKISDTVQIEKRIKPIYNFKASVDF